ncbi:SDR family oxidoreductase [Jeotgalibacillus terrae]|uniref:SDR family oxidoreductase n=1 Tax=Jeotgalibacillus terrae TaxID=587735 RepID=A0ABW5ZMQ7_9BACL|nr:SDR family oxidoreductase [Jeotgalibacillus terrae]MBM7580223.1 NAD(P)-dependent dehydrogenase (short-subunit alcohol dehydrogenase family) [Jeotgalibacillus terrae]
MEFSKVQKNGQPAQHQEKQPGEIPAMNPEPIHDDKNYKGSGKLEGKTALITGGDSGIGKAAAIAYAKEGANVAIVYLDEHDDAKKTKEEVQAYGAKCLILSGDVGNEEFCKLAISSTVKEFAGLDILVNNAAEQHPQYSIEDISAVQLEKTFKTNIFSMFHLVKAALPHLKEGSCIINTSSVTAYAGNEQLIDYSATKGAITSFTRSLAKSLTKKKIRVNAVAPGPIWTPLIPSTFESDKVAEFGAENPQERPGQPAELAPAYVLLASNDSSYMTGQTIHINGGTFVSS